MGKPAEHKMLNVPLIQSFVVKKIKWGKDSFKFWKEGQQNPEELPAKQFITAQRQDDETILLTVLTKFEWPVTDKATCTSVNSWLERWDRPGRQPVFIRKARIPK